MPFQYSLHILHEDGTLEHKEFLGDENSDPRRALSKQMLQEITPTGSIIAFNKGFEQGQIKNYKKLEQLSTIAIKRINANKAYGILKNNTTSAYYHPLPQNYYEQEKWCQNIITMFKS